MKYSSWLDARGLIVLVLLLSVGRSTDAQLATQPIEPATAKLPDTRQGGEVLADTWDAMFIQGKRVGYGHTRATQFEEMGRTLQETEMTLQLNISRLGQKVSMSMDMRSVETPSGEVVRFVSKVGFGPTPTVSEGRVKGKEMVLKTKTRGKTVTNSIAWKPVYRGFFAAEQSLQQRPLKPGERRRFQGLVPVFNRIAEIELVGGEVEETKLLDGKQRLQKITSITRFGPIAMESFLWVDDKGVALKSYEPSMKQESFRTTREIALKGINQPGPDVIQGTLVSVKGLDDAENARQVRYRLRVEEESPEEIFPDSVAQSIKSGKEHSADLIVRRVSAMDDLADSAAPGAKPTAEDSQPNSWIQSDDRRVTRLAGEVAPDEKDPARLAIHLEKHVHDLITKKNFSTAMATAAEVAESRQGDCTEHAMLLAALARARGIPARVVMGLVYVKPLRGFGYHMWNEVWVDGAWRPLDATRAQGGTGVGHIKVAHSNLSNEEGAAAFLPVIRVVGRLQIEVVEVLQE